MIYLANTFSPMMLPEKSGYIAMVREMKEIPKLPDFFISIISHHVTAKVISTLIGFDVPCSRTNVALKPNDEVICIIPNFRASEAREFTREEVENAGFRVFSVIVR